jgi:tetratricopeptide (TPR) repeat protein
VKEIRTQFARGNWQLCLLLWILFVPLPSEIWAQTRNPASAQQQAKELYDQKRWPELVQVAKSTNHRSADLNFYYGTALAQLARWQEAEAAFIDGQRQQPADKRFPIELAGVAFKQQRYPQAAKFLCRALKLDPADSYANDFLGTIYFLEGNLDGALKYWNRVGKPVIANITNQPTPRVDGALLDRALAFSPASELTAGPLRTTNFRIRGVGIFRDYRFNLLARDDGKFDIVFENKERNGLGRNWKEALFLTFRSIPFQTLHFDYFNIGLQARNMVFTYRFDAEKRRVLVQFSSPFQNNPKYRYEGILDLRGENWNIQTSFKGPTTLLGSFNMRREALGFNFASFESGRWQWMAGAEVSHRDFRSIIPGPALTPDLLAKGHQLKQLTQLDVSLWHVPEHRLTFDGTLSSQAGRIWSAPGHSFEKLQGALRTHWFPQASGDDWEMHHQLRAGKTFGDLPFDELFTLGMYRDNELWMRMYRDNELWMHGHIATRDGRKGSGPLGRNYFLSNWALDKRVYQRHVVDLKLGPLLDIGKATDPVAGLGSHKWLWDTGAQAKVRVFGMGVVFSYGKDLRSGNNAFYVSMLREP